MDPELVCCNMSTGKSEGLGELKDGMVFDVSLSMARRLLAVRQKEDGEIGFLEKIAEKVAFEIAVGRNGKVWINGGGMRETLIVGRALQETDREVLSLLSQDRLVRKLLRDV